jgi:hypothetical protein
VFFCFHNQIQLFASDFGVLRYFPVGVHLSICLCVLYMHMYMSMGIYLFV